MVTIRSSREIDGIFRRARRAAHPLVTALAAPTLEGRCPSGRVAFVAGTRLGNAVLRNRSRRVLREAVRRAAGPWPGYDVIVIARAGTAVAAARDLDAALSTVLMRLGVTL